MAAMNKIIVAASALAAVAAAVPFRGENRRVVTQVVTETAWTTVDVVATVFVDEAGTPFQTQAAGVFAESTPSAPSWNTSSLNASSSTITSAVVTPSSLSSASIVPEASPATTSSPAPVSSSAPVSSASSSASAVNVENRQASETNTCEGEGAACVGDVTHWDGGLGACGWTVNTETDLQIALPVGLMGDLSNSNPYCGRSLTILNPVSGTTAQATVGDKCMGCAGRAIDLTNTLFNLVTDGQGDGRVSGIEWWFN